MTFALIRFATASHYKLAAERMNALEPAMKLLLVRAKDGRERAAKVGGCSRRSALR